MQDAFHVVVTDPKSQKLLKRNIREHLIYALGAVVHTLLIYAPGVRGRWRYSV